MDGGAASSYSLTIVLRLMLCFTIERYSNCEDEAHESLVPDLSVTILLQGTGPRKNNANRYDWFRKKRSRFSRCKDRIRPMIENACLGRACTSGVDALNRVWPVANKSLFRHGLTGCASHDHCGSDGELVSPLTVGLIMLELSTLGGIAEEGSSPPFNWSVRRERLIVT